MAASLAETLRSRLAAAADPARAPGMQAYMKSAMPYLGVSAVPLRQVCKTLFAPLRWPDAGAWAADVRTIWRGARYREERYAAIELTGVRAARPFQRIGALPLYEELIVTGAWWDHVDVIATQRLWTLLENDRAEMRAEMLSWSRDGDIWKRRSAILCQLPAKANTDLDLLQDAIAPSFGSREFFLNKAIGWALRHYARTDPDWVRAYVAGHADRLNRLSKREALKHL